MLVINNFLQVSFDSMWSYCCSIGMKPLEFRDSHYSEVVEKLLKGFKNDVFHSSMLALTFI
jgi:hypothetical protein